MVNNGNNQQAHEQYVQFAGGQRSTQNEADWDSQNLTPPEPPGGRYDLWELQWCKWWGWTWVKKPEGEDPTALCPSALCPSAQVYRARGSSRSKGKKNKKNNDADKKCCSCCFPTPARKRPPASEVYECGRESCSYSARSPQRNYSSPPPPAEPAVRASRSRKIESKSLCCDCRSRQRIEPPPVDLCCECRSRKVTEPNPVDQLCSSCGQPLPQSPSEQPQMTNVTQEDKIEPVPRATGSGFPGTVCCRCAQAIDPRAQNIEPRSTGSGCGRRAMAHDLCSCGRPACPPNCKCSLSKTRQGRSQSPQTVNMVKVYENNPHYLAEMFKLKAFDYACAQKPFSLLMRNNNRLMKLLTEKNCNFSPSGDLPKPVDTSFTLPESAIKSPLESWDDLQRKEHEHCKILTAVCDAILANHDHDKNQFNEFPDSLQVEKFLKASKGISKDASAQSATVEFEELSDVKVQTEITMKKKKDSGEKRRRKKELPDVHITTSNRTVIVGKHIRAESASELKGSIPKRRSKNQSSDRSTASHSKHSHSKKQNPDYNRTSSRYHLKCVDSNMKWRQPKIESANNSETSESSDND